MSARRAPSGSGHRQSVQAGDEGKRAPAVAREIQAEIVRRHWPVGEILGSEADLIERFGVSRSVLREAIRLLESRWVARMRQGPGGGLVVTAPDPGVVRDATRLYLDYQGVRSAHLHEVWLALELVAITTLSQSIDEAGVARLRELIEEEAVVLSEDAVAAIDLWMTQGLNLHAEISRQARNPALELFLGVVVDLSLEYHTDLSDPAASAQWLHSSHVKLVEAIVGGDTGVAQLRFRHYMTELLRGGGMGPAPADLAEQIPATR